MDTRVSFRDNEGEKKVLIFWIAIKIHFYMEKEKNYSSC